MKLLCLVIILCSAFSADGLPSRKPSLRERAIEFFTRLIDGKFNVNCPEALDLRCPRDDVTFWLYTRDTMDNPTLLDQMNPGSMASKFVNKAPLKVLVHGYKMHKDKGILNLNVRTALFKRGEYNVICVDWSSLTKEHCYAGAAVSVPTVGRCVAQFLSKLLEVQAGVFTDVHMLGSSLGAHVVSWASSELSLTRVTLFDPVLPMFNSKSSLFKKAKAGFVDVWHSNVWLYGRAAPDGNADIYFNNGSDQPGCRCETMCSHIRSIKYYAETISSSSPLMAFRCPGGWPTYMRGLCHVSAESDLARFGEEFQVAVGSYVAFTNAKSPYIIPADQYLDKTTFYNFKNTHNEKCYQNRFTAFFARLLI